MDIASYLILLCGLHEVRASILPGGVSCSEMFGLHNREGPGPAPHWTSRRLDWLSAVRWAKFRTCSSPLGYAPFVAQIRADPRRFVQISSDPRHLARLCLDPRHLAQIIGSVWSISHEYARFRVIWPKFARIRGVCPDSGIFCLKIPVLYDLFSVSFNSCYAHFTLTGIRYRYFLYPFPF